MRKQLLIAAFGVLAAGVASAQPSHSSQLDFLVGDWVLHNADGEAVGNSRIVAQVPGTMLFEERSVGQGDAQPLWFENAERHGGWTQLFVGPAGMTREFVPVSAPGEWPVVMGSDVTLRDGTRARFRMTLSRESEDRSRRVLEMSRDGGATWQTAFDYVYRRRRG